jgi:hypothetical protein
MQVERIPVADNGSVIVKSPSLRIEPLTTTKMPGEVFDVAVWIDYAVDMGAFQFSLEWNSSIIQLVDVDLGPYLGSTGRTLGPITKSIHPGKLLYGATTLGDAPAGPTGSGMLVTLHFKALMAGETKLDLTDGVVSMVEAPNKPIQIKISHSFRRYILHN